jgi:hypothetical protein
MPQRLVHKKTEDEGQIILAIQALQKNEISSLRRAAELYNVKRSTLSDRLNGRIGRVDTRANSHILTQNDENALESWLLSMDERGYPLSISAVHHAAVALLQNRRGDTSIQIGKNWANRFVNRRPALKANYSRNIDAQRKKCEDPVLIQGWFDLLCNTIKKHGIVDTDIYNFDETGFGLGLATHCTRVVTASDRSGKPIHQQQGDREWVTVIEAVNAGGWAIPPMIILKGQQQQSTWYIDTNLPPD